MVDETGAVVESYEYDAYGNPRIFDAAGSEILDGISQIGNRYLFQGREYDSATGLYYFRARWYDPETGRWLSKDPIGISGGFNQYEFCGSNPVNRVDPYGESWKSWAGGFMMAVGGALMASGVAAALSGVGAGVGLSLFVAGGALSLAGAALSTSDDNDTADTATDCQNKARDIVEESQRRRLIEDEIVNGTY